MSFVCTERRDLNHWLKQKKQCDKQIAQFTTDPITHKKYAKLFQTELERRIKEKYPRKHRVEQYQVYQVVRHKLYLYFGYTTPMMTKTEYEEALRFISQLDY